MEESDRVKIYSARNPDTNMGVCVCLREKAWEGEPKDDVVGLCFGKCNEKGRPKHQFAMTPDEATCLGEALIGARWFYIKREHEKDAVNNRR